MNKAVRSMEEGLKVFENKVAAFQAEKMAPVATRRESLNRETEALRLELGKFANFEAGEITSAGILGGETDVYDERSAREKIDSNLKELRALEDRAVSLQGQYHVLSKDLAAKKKNLNMAKSEIYHKEMSAAIKKAKPALLRIIGLAALYRFHANNFSTVLPKYSPDSSLRLDMRTILNAGVISPDEIDFPSLVAGVEK